MAAMATPVMPMSVMPMSVTAEAERKENAPARLRQGRLPVMERQTAGLAAGFPRGQNWRECEGVEPTYPARHEA